MPTVNKRNKSTNQKIYFTQHELAERWCVSESTIKKWREDGQIPFFVPPGSNKPLYPIEHIEIIEKTNFKNAKKEELSQNRPAEIKRKSHVNSTCSKNEWRI